MSSFARSGFFIVDGIIGEDRMRTYQNWLRSEICERFMAINAERDELQRARDAIPGDASLSEYRALCIETELWTRTTALDHEVIALESELRIRDKPEAEQAEYGGPGRD